MNKPEYSSHYSVHGVPEHQSGVAAFLLSAPFLVAISVIGLLPWIGG